jgi:hypothetical protein
VNFSRIVLMAPLGGGRIPAFERAADSVVLRFREGGGHAMPCAERVLTSFSSSALKLDSPGCAGTATEVAKEHCIGGR